MREDKRCAPESGSSLPDRGVADTVLAEPRERSSPAVATTGKHADAHTYGPLARSGAVDGANATSDSSPLPAGGRLLFRTGWDTRADDPHAFLVDGGKADSVQAPTPRGI